MFDLEKSIAGWRRQMSAAGIAPPALLDELESHLREEIEQRLKTGADEHAAFAGALAQIGGAAMLKDEFRKGSRWSDILAESVTTNRVLGLLWFVYCLGSFYHTTNGLLSVFPSVPITPLFVLAWLMDLIYLRGIIASVLLFGGATRERRFILLLAVLDAFGGVAVLLLKSFHPLSCAFTILGFVTLWLFRSRSAKPLPA